MLLHIGFKGATMKDNKAAAFGGGAVIGALGGPIHNGARKLQLEMENGHAKTYREKRPVRI
jgi:hypothetical protein